jgi:hypothetical protein
MPDAIHLDVSRRIVSRSDPVMSRHVTWCHVETTLRNPLLIGPLEHGGL